MTPSIQRRLALIVLIARLISGSTITVLSGQEKNQPPRAKDGTTVTPPVDQEAAKTLVAAAPTCPSATDPQPRVTQISRYNRDTKTAENNGGDLIVQLRDEVVVKIENLSTLRAEAGCSRPPKQVVLFLDGRPIKHAVAFPPTDPNTGELRFSLDRTEDSRDVWTYILGSPGFDARPTKLSVGVEDSYAIPSDVSQVRLMIIPLDGSASGHSCSVFFS